MSSQKYVCIDLDGTIAHYDEWQGEDHFGEPVSGVQSALSQMRSAGWKIIIYTTRANKKLVGGYLKRHAIPFDHINENPEQPKNAFGGKPYADAYIDDRGIQFNGNWKATASELLRFVPWEKRVKTDQSDDLRKEAINFLGRDYGEVFNELRAYDAQIWEILKYSFAQIVGSITAVWVIFSFAYATGAPDYLKTLWEPVGAVILIISFLFGLLAVRLILRNRVYFSAAARYINDQRGFFLAGKPLGFSNLSGYFDDFRRPKTFSPDSTQLLSIYLISLLDSLLLGFGTGLLGQYFGISVARAVSWGVGVWFVSFACIVGLSIRYLVLKKDISANKNLSG